MKYEVLIFINKAVILLGGFQNKTPGFKPEFSI